MINEYSKIHKKFNLKKCNIINLSSIYGLLSPDFSIYGKNDRFNSEIYGATKASVIQLTKYYAVILSKENIIINCISQGILNKKTLRQKILLRIIQKSPKTKNGKCGRFIYSSSFFIK